MKIPPIGNLGCFVVQNYKKGLNKKPAVSRSLSEKDVISFGTSTAYYLKKYKTLPEEIRNILSPKDAIDMFRNMESIQKGSIKGKKIGQGKNSTVFKNPWLEKYYFLIIDNPKESTQLVYSRYNLGDAIWSDKDNDLIQLIKAGEP